MVSTLSPDGAFRAQSFASQFNTDFTLIHRGSCFSNLVNNYLGSLFQMEGNFVPFKTRTMLSKNRDNTKIFCLKIHPRLKKITKCVEKSFNIELQSSQEPAINVRDKMFSMSQMCY